MTANVEVIASFEVGSGNDELGTTTAWMECKPVPSDVGRLWAVNEAPAARKEP